MSADTQPPAPGFVVVRCPKCQCTVILLEYEGEDRAYWCPCQAGTQALVIARAALRETDAALLLLY